MANVAKEKKVKIGLWIPAKVNLKWWINRFTEGEINYVELEAGILEHKSQREVEDLALTFKERKIRVYSVHGPFSNDLTLSNPNEGKRKKATESLVTIMIKAANIGAKVVVTHPGGILQKKEKLEERYRLLYQSLDSILPTAEALGIRIALENMIFEHPGAKAEDLVKIIESVNSPYLGVCFDTGHSHITNNIKDDFEVLKEHILVFHIHDNDGTRDNHIQPPYGTIDWDEFSSLVNGSPYEGPLNLECFPWGRAEPSWAKKEVEWLLQGKILKIDFPKPSFARCIGCGHFVFGDKENPVCYCSHQAQPHPRIGAI